LAIHSNLACTPLSDLEGRDGSGDQEATDGDRRGFCSTRQECLGLSHKRTLANGGRVPRVRDGRLADPGAAGLAGVEKGMSLELPGVVFARRGPGR
jgi:hypothetical protein